MAVKPYEMMTTAEIREILNRRAESEQDLLQGIEEVDASSIYYHTHSYYLQGKYQTDQYPNDFATWVAVHVRDRVLSERLAVVDPWTLGDVEALRQQLITIIEDHLETMRISPRALFGDPFDFVRSHTFAVPTGTVVRTREDLREAFRAVPPESLYYHFFEDAFGKRRKTGSLVSWVAEELRDRRLAESLSRLNPYRLHIEPLRATLLRVMERTPAGEAA